MCCANNTLKLPLNHKPLLLLVLLLLSALQLLLLCNIPSPNMGYKWETGTIKTVIISSIWTYISQILEWAFIK